MEKSKHLEIVGYLPESDRSKITINDIRNKLMQERRVMTKELLKIEFRYEDEPDSIGSTHKTKTITIGIYDTLEEAVKEGNKCLQVLKEYFEVRGDDKFKVVGLFGAPQRLVTNCCYPTRGIQYFASIIKQDYADLSETIKETFKARDRYEAHRRKEDE